MKKITNNGRGYVQRTIKRFMDMDVQIAEIECEHYNSIRNARVAVWKAVRSLALDDDIHVLTKGDRLFLLKMNSDIQML